MFCLHAVTGSISVYGIGIWNSVGGGERGSRLCFMYLLWHVHFFVSLNVKRKGDGLGWGACMAWERVFPLADGILCKLVCYLLYSMQGNI